MPGRSLSRVTVPSHGNNQQPNDLMSRSVHRRLLCDGSFQKDIQKTGIGVISVNPEGHVLDEVAGHFCCRTSIVAKARAVYTACVIAAREGGRTDIWSDCREVVVACNAAPCEWPWECAAVIAAVHEVLDGHPLIQVRHCPMRYVAVLQRHMQLRGRQGKEL
ncbi:hypothetical protein LINGRAHAP2_LOCUS10320 [Linum grandiflorum]